MIRKRALLSVDEFEPDITFTINVTRTDRATSLIGSSKFQYIKGMSVDGVVLSELISAYTFSTTGEHIIQYELIDHTTIPPSFYMSSMKSFEIGERVETIDGSFTRCTSLTEVNIPDNVKTVTGDAFWDSSLQTLRIGSGVSSWSKISGGQLMFCDRLSTIIVSTDNQTYDSRNNCNAIIETATNKLVDGCRGTIIPNTIVTIGASAFNAYRKPSQDPVVIPNSVTTIESGAFGYRSGSGNVTIGTGVTYIGNNAFDNSGEGTLNWDVYHITIYATTPPTLGGTSVFRKGSNYDTLTIKVPSNRVTAYKNAWTDYADYITAI